MVLVIVFAALVIVRSWYPAQNLVSRRQRMNSSYDPLRLVNTYGAFGSISRIRQEVILEGTTESDVSDETVWAEYEFKGKPGDVKRMPRQWSPYHLRLDWMTWFLPLSAGIRPALVHPDVSWPVDQRTVYHPASCDSTLSPTPRGSYPCSAVSVSLQQCMATQVTTHLVATRTHRRVPRCDLGQRSVIDLEPKTQFWLMPPYRDLGAGDEPSRSV